ncbi:LysR substrate-binding domain-containing protein [Paracoccus aminophilus]|uniref:Transcriptional regulator, LysR family n=1 Tax=Paracoccus aminophilus JCM 7686 TaxID=1367847 RepID=S5Y7T1_PARAH|nr:LysR substrate-binding domain-containing protein [Paracoccus aminophilus]AGT07408.1 transcriptional regulator, LysR family [Paracoccus aminophilus JCM 7686]
MKPSRKIPLNALRAFEATARLMSFTKAGEELGMTQTAISYQIRLLEDQLGEPLFLRRPRHLALSDAGAKLHPKIAQAFALIDEAVAGVETQSRSALVIHTNATFASRWLAAHIGTFQLEHPEIAVRLELSNDLVDFSASDADVAIRAGRGQWPGLTSHFVMKGHFTPMLSPALAATIGGVHEPADLLKLRIIDPGDPWWRMWFTAAGLPDADLDSRARSRMGAQVFEAAAAIAGQGVGILNPDFYADDVALGRLIQPFDLIEDSGYHYWFVYPESRANVPKIRAFRAFMRKAMPSFRD